MVSLVELKLTKLCKKPVTWSFMCHFFIKTSPLILFWFCFPKGWLFSPCSCLKRAMCQNKRICSIALSFCEWPPAINLKKRFYLADSLVILLGGVLLPLWTLIFLCILYFFKDSCFLSKVLLECDYSSQLFSILKELLYSKKFCCSWGTGVLI